MIVRVLLWIIQAYLIILFVRILMSWFPIDPWSPWAKVTDTLARVTDPILRPLRRIVPPLRVGQMAIDLSPFVVVVALSILINVLQTR